MSSRGQHVGGTDGTDHQFRERVASQYGVSATNKSRLKLLVSVHYLLGAAHLARLVPHLVKYLGVDLEMPLPPTPNSFVEYFWLLSLPFTLMAMMAARRYVGCVYRISLKREKLNTFLQQNHLAFLERKF